MSDRPPPQHRGPLPPVYLYAAIALMLGLHFVLPVAQWSDSAWRIAAGLPLLLAGAVLNVWADQLFKRAGTTVKPFEPSTALIVTGPFALTRHPMYLGMALALAGVALALGSATPWAVLPVFAWLITRRFIIPEERKMEATFGARYLEYAVKVRRWL